MSQPQMPNRELYQYYSHLNEQGSPHGLTSGAVNFFLATADTQTHQTMERTVHWNSSFAQQPTSTAVYGPSKPPRLQQFVDLASNVCSMTPFFSLGSDITIGEKEKERERGNGQEKHHQEEESEMVNHAMYVGQVFNTPQQQKKDRLPMSSVITPTPSSAMGMTISPATACRDMHQITPAQTGMCGNSVNTTITTTTTTTTMTTNTSSNSNNTINVEMRSRPQLQKMNTTPTVVVVHSNSLTNELESAFQEHRIRKNTKGMMNNATEEKGKDEQEEEEVEEEEEEMNNNNISNNTMEEGEEEEETTEMMVSVNTAGKTSDTVSISPISVSCDDNSTESKRRSTLIRREERTTQRRNKDQRQGKSKNSGHANSQRHNNQQNKNNSDNTSRSLLVSLANCDNARSMGDGKKYMLNLLCHGDRKVTVVSFLELHTGYHVLFEGDRGVDLGEVIGCEEAVNESNGVNKGNERGVLHMVRCATEEEVEEWRGSLVKKEEEAVIECREACQELGLTIHVAGAAFQFDRQKLIFLYESDERVDFRTLLQVMFSKYRCRIWMERINAPS